MSIPTLCQACYTHTRSTVVKACPFCRDAQFPEQVLCDLVRQAAVPFEQTTAHVLWLASDHLHLYIDATPDYALDEIVDAIREHLEHEMTHLLPELKHSNQPVWHR